MIMGVSVLVFVGQCGLTIYDSPKQTSLGFMDDEHTVSLI